MRLTPSAAQLPSHGAVHRGRSRGLKHGFSVSGPRAKGAATSATGFRRIGASLVLIFCVCLHLVERGTRHRRLRKTSSSSAVMPQAATGRLELPSAARMATAGSLICRLPEPFAPRRWSGFHHRHLHLRIQNRV